MYTILPTYSSSIFKGDPVLLNANGTVNVGAAGTALLGVFAGCEYVDSTGKPTLSNFYPASQPVQSGSEIRCYVYDDPSIVYEIQAVGQLSAVLATAMAYIGDEADITTYGAGSTSTGLSIVSLATGTMAGAASQKQFRIIGFGLAPDNAPTDLYPILRVTLAQSQFRAATTAV
jgi:hypothetical protein